MKCESMCLLIAIKKYILETGKLERINGILKKEKKKA